MRCILCFGGWCVLGFFSSSSFGWLTIGKFDCAFVAGELAFSFHIASACDVCCDLRRRRRKKKKFSRHRKHWNTKKNPKEISSRETEDQLEHYEE